MMCKQLADLPDYQIRDMVSVYQKAKLRPDIDIDAVYYKIKLDQNDCHFIRDFHKRVTRKRLDDKKLYK